MLFSPSKVSVLMPVYNGKKSVQKAIDSILGQSLADFQLVVIDDGSTDSTPDILRAITDPRLIVITNPKNLGKSESLNLALREVKSEYVARMDHDDISLPRRLEEQVNFMEAHPDASICGGFARTFGYQNNHLWKSPTDSDAIRCMLLFENPIFHPSVMMRRTDILEHGLYYDPEFSRTEDYDLWERAAQCLKIINLPKVLVYYSVRTPESQTDFRISEASECRLIRRRQLRRLVNDVSPDEEDLHRRLSTWQFADSATFLEDADRWLTKLSKANSVYPVPAFSTVLADRLFAFCNAATHLGSKSRSVFETSELIRHSKISPLSKAHFAARCLVRWKRRGLASA